MCSSEVNRVIVRKQLNISSSGSYSYQLDAPPGYRVVSAFHAVAQNESGRDAAVDFIGSYPYNTSDPVGVNYANADGVYDAWRFQIKVNDHVPLWLGVICERSEEPDVYLDRGVDYV